MRPFEPRAVPPSSWRGWLVAGVALSTRRLGAFVTLGVLAVAAHTSLDTFGIGTVLVPLAFGLGCLVAECADHGRSVLASLRVWPWRAGVRLVLVGVIATAGFWAIGLLVLSSLMLAGWHPDDVPIPASGAASASRSPIEALCGAWFLSAAVVLFGTSLVIGFLVPLLALGALPLRVAWRLALTATRRNDFVIVLVAGLAGAAVTALLTPFLVVPWVAIVSSVLYVAWRDVFLGRADNLPVAVASAQPAVPR